MRHARPLAAALARAAAPLAAALALALAAASPASAQLGTPATVAFCTVHETCAEDACTRAAEPNFEIREREGAWVLRVDDGKGDVVRLGPVTPVAFGARGWSLTVPGEPGAPARTLHLNRAGWFAMTDVSFPGPTVRMVIHEGRCFMARLP